MSQSLTNTIILAFAFLALFAVAELLYHKLKIKADYTRNIVHIGTGLLTLLFPLLIKDLLLVSLLCASFLILLLASIQFNFLQSVNSVKRSTLGSLLYPVAVVTCYVAYEFYAELMFFYLPILILAIADPLAANIGKLSTKYKMKITSENKTLIGSISFFCAAVIIAVTTFYVLPSKDFVYVPLMILCVAIASTAAELFSRRGTDNITIPIAVLIILILFQ